MGVGLGIMVAVGVAVAVGSGVGVGVGVGVGIRDGTRLETSHPVQQQHPAASIAAQRTANIVIVNKIFLIRIPAIEILSYISQT